MSPIEERCRHGADKGHVALASQVPGEAVRVSRTTADSLPDIDLPDGEVWLGLIEVTAGFVDLLGLTLGAYNPSATLALRLAALFEISVEQLFSLPEAAREELTAERRRFLKSHVPPTEAKKTTR